MAWATPPGRTWPPAWVASAGDAVIDPGAPVNVFGQVASGEPAQTAEIAGYSIIRADSADAARSLLSSHPCIARGGTLHISEYLGA